MYRFTWGTALFVLLAIITISTPWTDGPVDAAPSNQERCPVMGFTINKDLFSDYMGKRIYFCCPSCPPDFKATPDTFMAEMKAAGIVLEDAPGHTS